MLNDPAFMQYIGLGHLAQPGAPAMPQAPGTPPVDQGAPQPAGLDWVSQRILGLPQPPPAPPQAAAPPPPPRPVPLPTPQTIATQQQQGYDQERAGIQAGAAAKGQMAQVEGSGELKAAQETEKRQADDAAAKAQADQEIQARRAALATDVENLSNTRVDPNRLVNSADTWQKVVGAISIGLGGWAARAKGGNGQNVALAIIQGQIDKDIQAQMADLETKKSALNAKGTLLQQDIALGRDATDARAKATSALYDTAMREVAAQVKMIGTQSAAAEGQQLMGQLEQKKAQADEAHWQAQQSIALQRAQVGIAAGHLQLAKQQQGFDQAQVMAGLPLKAAKEAAELPGIKAKADLEEAQAKLALGKVGQPGAEPGIIYGATNKDGTPFVAKTAKQEIVDKTNTETLPPLIGAIQAMDQNIELAKNYDRITDPLGKSEAAQKMRSNAAFIASVAHPLFGKVSENEINLVEKSAGDPAAIISQEATMNGFRERLRLVGQNHLAGLGYKGRWEPPDQPDAAFQPGQNAKVRARATGSIQPTSSGDPMFDYMNRGTYGPGLIRGAYDFAGSVVGRNPDKLYEDK